MESSLMFFFGQIVGIIERCDEAIKLIRARHNKVPILKFQFNRASMLATNNANDTNSVSKSPFQMQSALNASFKITTPADETHPKTVAGLKHLPKRVKDVAIALGINSTFLFEKLRTKELTTQLTETILEHNAVPAIRIKQEFPTPTTASNIPKNPVPVITVQKCNSETQTSNFECGECVERTKIVMVSKQTQMQTKTCSIGVQTNEKDYREPIVEQLARLTAAQLVAIKDFAEIIVEPRPRNAAELYKLKERMMDVYNLSQRDADAVRTAEENRLDDVNFIEQSMRSRSNDMFSNENSRDFDHRSIPSPGIRFNDSDMRAGNFEPNRYVEDRRGMNVDAPRVLEERTDRDYRRMREMREIRDREEREHQQMLEMERDRERILERDQMMYDEEQRRLEDIERRRSFEHDQHVRQMQQQQQQQQPQPQQYRFQDDIRLRDVAEVDRGFNRNAQNRRGRGAFSQGGRRR